MTINLKQIRELDSDNIKLDKINYNFDQLIVNGGGPKGQMGPDGNLGPQGYQGAIGVQGEIGEIGVQGPDADSAESYWEAVPQDLSTSANTVATLFSKHPIVGNPEYASVVGAGFLNGDFSYTYQQGNGLPNYQWVVSKKQSDVIHNLRFTSGDVLLNSFNISIESSMLINNLSLGFIDNQNSQLNLQSKEHIIRSSFTGNNLLKASDLGGEINVDTIFENKVSFNAPLRIDNSDAGTNKVAISIDNTGEIIFKTTSELGGSVKVGTIISILPSIFSDPTKFICEQTIDTTLNPDVPIELRMGAGIGDYAGWYVCNGQEWTDGDLISIEVPDLNSYSYQIISNPISADPNSQGYINVNNNEIQLIGGADIFVNVYEDGISSPLYDISLTDNSTEPLIASIVAGNTFKIKKLPQIIYLGDTDLYWVQLGTGQSAIGDYNSVDYSVVDYSAF